MRNPDVRAISERHGVDIDAVTRDWLYRQVYRERFGDPPVHEGTTADQRALADALEATEEQAEQRSRRRRPLT